MLVKIQDEPDDAVVVMAHGIGRLEETTRNANARCLLWGLSLRGLSTIPTTMGKDIIKRIDTYARTPFEVPTDMFSLLI